MSVRAFALLALLPTAALAQAGDNPAREPTRTRIYLGPQISPASPGAKQVSIGPFFDVSRARGDAYFAFEAPDESFGFPIIDAGGIELGPALGFIGKRNAGDLAVPLHDVGFSFEIGGFAQAYVTPELRLRVEGRRAISGHRGWIGELSADYIARDGDDWLFSIGPRVRLADATYHRAWYGVTPADSIASGLAAYRPGAGVESVGISGGYLRQLTPRLGLAAYARYDRLVGDAAASPYVRAAGARGQPSAGLALSYTFGQR